MQNNVNIVKKTKIFSITSSGTCKDDLDGFVLPGIPGNMDQYQTYLCNCVGINASCKNDLCWNVSIIDEMR